MTSDLWIQSLRAENLAGDYNPVKGDYPARLFTKRLLAQCAGEILQSRAHAPAPVGVTAGTFHPRRPPPG